MKKIFSIILCLCLIVGCVGCGDNSSTNNTDPTNMQSTNPTTGATEPNTILSDTKVEKYLWEKDLVEFTLLTIKLDKDWNNKIIIGSTTISSSSAIDIAKTDNFYNTDASLCGDLEAAYYVQKKSVPISTKFKELDDDACIYGQFTMLGATYNTNVMVEGFQFVGTPNIYINNGMSHLIDNAPYQTNDEFGIGSTLSYVESVIGKPNSTFDVDMGDGQSTTTNVYISDNVEMTLVFTWMTTDGSDNGALTSISWIPTTVRSELHSNISTNTGVYEEVPTVDATISNSDSTEITN